MNYKNFILTIFSCLSLNAGNFELSKSKKPLACFTILDETKKNKLSKFSQDEFKKFDYGIDDAYTVHERLTNSDPNEQLAVLRHLFLQFNLYQFANYRALLNSFPSTQFFSQLSSMVLKHQTFHYDLRTKTQGFKDHQLCHYFHCQGKIEQFSDVPSHIIDELKTFISNKDVYSHADECLFLVFMLYGEKVKTPMSKCLQELFTANPVLFIYQNYLRNWQTHSLTNQPDEKLVFSCVNTLGLQALTYLSESNDIIKQEFTTILKKTLEIADTEKRAIILLAMELYAESIKACKDSLVEGKLKELCILILDYYDYANKHTKDIISITKLWLPLINELTPAAITTIFDAHETLGDSLINFAAKNAEYLNPLQQKLIKLFIHILNDCSKSERKIIYGFFHEFHHGIKIKINEHSQKTSSILRSLLSWGSKKDPALQIAEFLAEKISPLNNQHSEAATNVFKTLGNYYAQSLKDLC